ncbi:MAG: HAD-IA family hydrolase [Lentisphaeraceae bacterium]|nr:HAD-IA family hydrolase [Lentisphaeraceae bacterium]
MNFKGYIFDFDGTLVNSAPDLANAVNELRLHYKLPELDRETIISYIGNGALKLVERSFQGTGIDPQEALKYFLDYYEEGIYKETDFYPGVENFLKELQSRDIPAVILTNKPQKMTDILLEKMGVAHYFKYAFGPDLYGKKPDPAGLLKCLDLLQLNPEDTLMVGDHHTDIFAANACKVKSVFLTYGYGEIGDSHPDYVFDSFDELFKFL